MSDLEVTTTSPVAAVKRPRDLRRLQRLAAVVILPVPPTVVAIGRLFRPDDSDTMRAITQITAQPGRASAFAILGAIGFVTTVPAFLAAARLSRRRRPTLTFIALTVNLLAIVGGYVMPALDSMYVAAATVPAEQRPGAAALIDAMWQQGLPGTSAALFVLGHIVGIILLGFSLRGSIPPLGWLAIALSPPAHAVAFILFPATPILDMAAWALLSVGFVFCAIAVARTPDADWDLPPVTKTP